MLESEILSTTYKLTFKNLSIIHVVNFKLKNSYLQIDKNGSIILKTPKVSDEYIQNLLLKKELWIQKQLSIFQNNKPTKINFEDEVLLFGEVYSIDVDEAKKLRECLEKLKINNKENIENCYDKFYKSFSQEYLTNRLKYYSKVMNLNYTNVKFKKMRRRWGSCSSTGIITFNTEMIKLEKELIDYIVIHELSHLVHMNHSKKFHLLVSQYVPHYLELNQRLRHLRLL